MDVGIKVGRSVGIDCGVHIGSSSPQWYGVKWDITEASPTVTRIASSSVAMNLHASLPVQSAMKSCLMNADGTVNYYLNASDWTKKTDNSASDLTGADGNVMVEIPAYYARFESDGNYRFVKFSKTPIAGFCRIPKMYISAYEASLNRVDNKLSSVVNATVDYRGGNNNASLDSAANSLLGKPATAVSRTNFRGYARNNGLGWQMNTYSAHKNMWWLFVVEYATRNSQSPVNYSLTSSGYRQGALGVGVTTASSTEWSVFSSYYPFVNCGASNSIGNSSGEVDIVVADFGGVGVDRYFKVNRYRGIEMPFGHIWKNTDGVNIKIQADASGGESQAFTCEDATKFNDSNYEGYTYEGLLPRGNGYMSRAIFGDNGSFLPATVVGGSTTYYSDYFYTSLPTSGESLRSLLLGGSSLDGSSAGFVCSRSKLSPTDAAANIGSRLCFLGA